MLAIDERQAADSLSTAKHEVTYVPRYRNDGAVELKLPYGRIDGQCAKSTR